MEKHKLKTGDRILCINNKDVSEYLIINKVYIISSIYYINHYCIEVIIDNIKHVYAIRRFRTLNTNTNINRKLTYIKYAP